MPSPAIRRPCDPDACIRRAIIATTLCIGLSLPSAIQADAPAAASTRWELSACKAWDFHLRFLLEQRVRYGIIDEAVDMAVLAELDVTARHCGEGRFRQALVRYAALLNMLNGEPDQDLADSEENMASRH